MRLLTLAMVILSCGYAAVSYADGDDFLTQVAPRTYKGQDWNMFGTALQQGLTTLTDGQKQEWSNPATGHGGYIQPVSTVSAGGRSCRNVQIGDTTGGTTKDYQYQFCKVGTQWQLVPKTPGK